jgi:penicillin V acylase-like amidase (Ntn superfamily)
MQQILPDGGVIISDIGLTLNDYYFPSEYAQEISGCAQAMGIETGWLAFMNLGYEVSDACTSIVAQTVDGKIYHARNLDFGEGMGFTNALRYPRPCCVRACARVYMCARAYEKGT